MVKTPIAFLAVLTVLLALAQGLITHSFDGDCVIDPIPYQKLLAETLEGIIGQDWVRVRSLLSIADQAQICSPALKASHEDLYESLKELIKTLQRASAIEERFSEGNTSGLRDDAREIYNELERLKQEVSERVGRYISSLGGRAKDKVSFFEYRLRIERDLDTIEDVIHLVMERLAKIYVQLSSQGSGAWFDIFVELPNQVYAGDQVEVLIRPELRSSNNSNINITDARVEVSLIIGYTKKVGKEITVRVGQIATVTLRIPDTASLKGIGLKPITWTVYAAQARAIVSAESLDGSISGFTILYTQVYAVEPPLSFYVPPYAQINETVPIKAISNADLPLNVSVYLDEVSNETLLTNTTVVPGTSWINVSLTNASVGYHKIIITSYPAGKYLSKSWSSAIVVGKPAVPLTVNVPRAVVVPPYIISVGGELGVSGDYDVIIYVDGVKVYNTTVSGRRFSADLRIPLGISTLIFGKSTIKVEVIPHTPSLSPSEYSVEVVVVNVVFTLAVASITGVLYLHPRPFLVFSSLARAVRRVKFGGASQVGSVGGGKRVFRPFKLRRYYVAIVGILSRLVGGPGAHETLREYLRRVEGLLAPKVVGLLRRLFRLFELDLYSPNTPDPGEASDLVRAVEEELGKEVSGS